MRLRTSSHDEAAGPWQMDDGALSAQLMRGGSDGLEVARDGAACLDGLRLCGLQLCGCARSGLAMWQQRH
jgi:hypothetical protein